MGLEIEAKMKLDDPAALRRRLESVGAVLSGEHLETNTFFDAPGAALRRADKGLRLRTDRNTSSGATRYLITFKGPRQPGELKTRQEIEFTVDDAAAATQLFEQLGYAATLSFQKRRQTWKLGGCEVDLDELPHLGWFVEIEGPSAAAVDQVRKSLGLMESKLISDSYIAMLAKWAEEKNVSDRIIEFT